MCLIPKKIGELRETLESTHVNEAIAKLRK